MGILGTPPFWCATGSNLHNAGVGFYVYRIRREQSLATVAS